MNKEINPREVYDRFNLIHSATHPQLVLALLLPDVRPKEFFGGISLAISEYPTLVSALNGYFRERGVPESDDFVNKLYWSFKPVREYPLREPLLEIMYGRIGGDEVPDKIFQNFSDEWEAAYFLAGIRLSRVSEFKGHHFSKKNLTAWRVPEIVARTMDLGISRLRKYEEELGKQLPHKKEVGQVVSYILNPHRDQLELEAIIAHD